MANELQFLSAALPIFLATLISGTLVALPLLRKTRLSLYEIVVFGFIIGLVLPPFLSFAESLAGIQYSLALAVFNIMVVAVAGAALTIKFDAWPREFRFDINLEADRRKLAVWGFLTLVMLWAFWARMQSLSPIFYEFDPYYYQYTTRFILVNGSIPDLEYTAWFPQGSSHRDPPLTNYLTASWYSIYTQGGAYDNYLLALVAGVYPPLAGALLCFLIFVFIKEEHGIELGMMGATLAAVIPTLIQKFAAGEQEIQPWGIFSSFFFFAAYALAMNQGARRYALLAGVAAISTIIGSRYSLVTSLVMGGYVGLQSLVLFFRNKDLRKFLELNSIIAAFFIVSWGMRVYYANSVHLPNDVLVLLFALGFAYVLHEIQRRARTSEQRLYGMLGLLFVVMLLLAVTPFGSRLVGYVQYAAGFAKPNSPLMMTVAEETPTSGQFQHSLGFLGWNMGSYNMVHLVLAATALSLAWSLYRGSHLALLYALVVFPLAYIGLNKSKYVLQLGAVLVLAFGVVLGEGRRAAELLAGRNPDEKRRARDIVLGLGAVLTLLIVLQPNPSAGWRTEGAFVDVTGTALSGRYWLANGQPNCSAIAQDGKAVSYYLRCSQIPDYWLDSMRFLKEETPPGSRVISWWDYGHWINFFGERNALTRNDHINETMDLEVADKFVFGPRDIGHSGPADLAEYMREHETQYVLFDIDLVAKWGALNYLACVYNNQTNMSFAEKSGIGSSECEQEHFPERVFIPLQRSQMDYCRSPDPSVQMVRGRSSFGYSYCVFEETVDGYTIPIGMVYEDDMTQMNRAILAYPQRVRIGGRDYAMYEALYFKDPGVWGGNETGWEDRKGRYYDSNFYNGFYLGKLDGFDLIYEYRDPDSNAVMIRIYKLRE